MSRWINGESDFASDLELNGEREFEEAQRALKSGKTIVVNHGPNYDVDSEMMESTGFDTHELLT